MLCKMALSSLIEDFPYLFNPYLLNIKLMIILNARNKSFIKSDAPTLLSQGVYTIR